jgi:hypothetical protein
LASDIENKIILRNANLLKDKDAKPWVYIHLVYDCQVATATWQFLFLNKNNSIIKIMQFFMLYKKGINGKIIKLTY